MTSKFDSEAERIASPHSEWLDEDDFEVLKSHIAAALEKAYQKGVLEQFDEAQAISVTPKYPTQFERGFSACRDAVLDAIEDTIVEHLPEDRLDPPWDECTKNPRQIMAIVRALTPPSQEERK